MLRCLVWLPALHGLASCVAWSGFLHYLVWLPSLSCFQCCLLWLPASPVLGSCVAWSGLLRCLVWLPALPALLGLASVDTASPPVVARRTHREYGVIVYRCSRYAIIQPDNPRDAEDTLLALRGEFESWTAPPRQTCVSYVRESGGTRGDLAKQLQLQGDPPRAAHAMLVQEMPSESRDALQRVFATLPRQGEHVCAVRRKWEALVGPVDVQGYGYSTLSALLQDHGASIWRVASGTYCCWRKSDGAHSLSPPTTSD